MNNQSITSISFVINAAYTVTFANSFFFTLLIDPTKIATPLNLELKFVKVGCGLICLIMSLRFFFGNNAYISNVMQNPEKLPWQKFYQFSFIALQSMMLLSSSYLVGQPRFFVHIIAALFVIETVWYGMTFVFDAAGVKDEDGSVDLNFLQAQITNLLFWIFAVLFLWMFDGSDSYLVASVLFIFLLNTAYDARANMTQYMGGATKP